MPPKTACRARGGVLYTQLAKFAALAVQGGVEPQTENCERRTAKTLITGRYRSGQTGQTVNLLAHAFAGSNPALPILRHLASSAASDFALLNTKSTRPHSSFVGQVVWQAILRRSPTRDTTKTGE